MNKLRNLNRLSFRLTTWLLAVLLIVSTLSFLPVVLRPNLRFVNASSEAQTFIDFAPRELGLENPRFAQGTGSTPITPSGWTQTDFTGKEAGQAVTGILDIDEFNGSEDIQRAARFNHDEANFHAPFPLLGLPESVRMEDGRNRFMMVNTTRDTETAIGFNSSTVTLNANGFFRISAWVRTYNFNTYGAAIRINGITDHDIAFTNITTHQNNSLNNGWEEFTFFIQTSAVRSEAIQLTLTLGDFYEGLNLPAHLGGIPTLVSQNAQGWAFFDNVQATEISPTVFALNTQNFASSDVISTSANGRNMFVDLSLPTTTFTLANETAPNNTTNFSFENLAPSGLPEHFVREMSVEDAGVAWSQIAQPMILNTRFAFDPNTNPYNLDYAPVSPFGQNAADPNILILSSFYGNARGENGRYHETAVGIESAPFVIEQNAFYRLSVWVNSHRIEGGVGANIVLTSDAEDLQAQPDNDNNQPPLRFTATNLMGDFGDADSASRHGWAQHAMYIQGSFFRDYTLTLGLWLGQEGNLSRGTAMFTGIRLETLTAAQFAEHSAGGAGGAPVNIDSPAVDGTITNGAFDVFTINRNEQDDSPIYPLVPVGWTFNTPETVNRLGFSQDMTFIEEHMDDVVSGVMITNHQHFTANRHFFGRDTIVPDTTSHTVLYMSSTQPVAFNYTSYPIPLEGHANQALTVRMRVDNVPSSDYGASLVLLDDGNIISSIENITSTNFTFHDFTFYLSNSSEVSRSLTIEIWLGLNERGTMYNSRNLSAGNIYVDYVTLTNIPESEFAQRMHNYRDFRNRNVRFNDGFWRDFAAINFGGFGLNEFDAFGSGLVRAPHLWTATHPSIASTANTRYGIFDSAHIEIDEARRTGEIPSHFINRDERNEEHQLWRNNVLMIEHNTPSSTRLTLNRPIHLEEDSHYKIQVALKVDIPYVLGAGAGIAINDDFYFTGIASTECTVHTGTRRMDTALVNDRIIDNHAFKIYTFLVYTGEFGHSVDLSITLGGESFSDFSVGRVYVNHIDVISITNTEFDAELEQITRTTNNVRVSIFGEQPTVTPDISDLPDRSAGFDVFLIPAIIFSVMFLMVFGILIFRRVAAHVTAKRARRESAPASKKAQKARYDRTSVAAKQAAGLEVEEVTQSQAEELKEFESFDDVIAPKVAPVSTAKPQPKTEAESVATTPTKTTETATTTPKAPSDFVDGFDD